MQNTKQGCESNLWHREWCFVHTLSSTWQPLLQRKTNLQPGGWGWEQVKDQWRCLWPLEHEGFSKPLLNKLHVQLLSQICKGDSSGSARAEGKQAVLCANLFHSFARTSTLRLVRRAEAPGLGWKHPCSSFTAIPTLLLHICSVFSVTLRSILIIKNTK